MYRADRIGAAADGRASQSPVFGFTLFFTLAIGLGLPYIALALAAGHIKTLPRSGDWLAWVEQLFGFVVVGLALYFLGPVVRGWTMRIMPYYVVAAGIFLGFISPAGRHWRPFLIFRSVLGTFSLSALLWICCSRRPSQRRNSRWIRTTLPSSTKPARQTNRC